MNVNENILAKKRKDNTNKLITTNPVLIGDNRTGPAHIQNNGKDNNVFKNKFKSCITPKNTIGTTSSSKTKTGSSSISSDKTQIILAISEGRGQARAVVGIAAIDINRPNLILCQINDTQNYINTLTKINVLNPVEILMLSVQIDNPLANRLFVCIKERYIPSHNSTLTSVPRKAFNSIKGLQYVNKLCTHTFSSVVLSIKQKFYALSSAAALLSYLEVENIIFAPNSIKVEYQEAENTTLIDIDTADRLELVSSPKEGARFATLFSILNHCCTNIGRRQLRADILQPPCTPAKVEARLDCVQELLEDPTLHMNLRNVLVKLYDVDQLLAFATVIPTSKQTSSDRHINYILLLKSKIGFIEPLMQELKNTTHPTFRALYHNLEQFPLEQIQKIVSCMIQSEAHPLKGQGGNFQRAFAIKRNINSYLDINRQAYSKIIDDMREYVNELANEHNLRLKVNYNARKAYHIQMYLNAGQKHLKKEDLPNIFIQIERLSNCFSMTTMELVHYNRRIKSTLDEIIKSSNQVLENVLLDLRGYVGHLYNLCDDVALLDVLQALAQASSSGHDYVRPDFSPEFMELIESRHPLLDYLPNVNSISNPVFASDFYNFHIITGPNMSGKSIYIRQIVIIQIMAQVGCYVPAKKATLRLSNRIFARIGQNDDLEHNASSFVLEMKEMQYIFNFMSDNSLIIVDEVCRSTSFDEGISIAYAISEALLKTKAYTFFATHFLYLQKLAQDNLNVSIWQMQTDEDVNLQKLYYKHILKPGITTIENYGIKAAKVCAISKLTIREAEKILKQLYIKKKVIYRDTLSQLPETTEKLQYRLTSELKLLELKNELTTDVYNEKIQEFEQRTGQTYEPILPKTVKISENHTDSPPGSSDFETPKERNVEPTYLLVKNNNFENETPTNDIDNQEIVINSKSNTVVSKDSNDIFNTMRSNNQKSSEEPNSSKKHTFDSQSTGNRIFNNAFTLPESSSSKSTDTRSKTSEPSETTSISDNQNIFMNENQNSVQTNSTIQNNQKTTSNYELFQPTTNKITENSKYKNLKKTSSEESSTKKSVHFDTPVQFENQLFQNKNQAENSDFSLFRKFQSEKSSEPNSNITMFKKQSTVPSIPETENDFSIFQKTKNSDSINRKSLASSIPETVNENQNNQFSGSMGFEKSVPVFGQSTSSSGDNYGFIKENAKSISGSIPCKNNQMGMENNFLNMETNSLSKSAGKIFTSGSDENVHFYLQNSAKDLTQAISFKNMNEFGKNNIFNLNNPEINSNRAEFAKKFCESVNLFKSDPPNPQEKNSPVMLTPSVNTFAQDIQNTQILLNNQKNLSDPNLYLTEPGKTTLTPYFCNINLRGSIDKNEIPIQNIYNQDIEKNNFSIRNVDNSQNFESRNGRISELLTNSLKDKRIKEDKIQSLEKSTLVSTPNNKLVDLRFFTPQVRGLNNFNLNATSKSTPKSIHSRQTFQNTPALQKSSSILSKLTTPVVKHPTEQIFKTPLLENATESLRSQKADRVSENCDEITEFSNCVNVVENLNCSEISIGTVVDDFNFFCKHNPAATSTPVLRKTLNEDLENCSVIQNFKTDTNQNLIEITKRSDLEPSNVDQIEGSEKNIKNDKKKIKILKVTILEPIARENCLTIKKTEIPNILQQETQSDERDSKTYIRAPKFTLVTTDSNTKTKYLPDKDLSNPNTNAYAAEENRNTADSSYTSTVDLLTPILQKEAHQTKFYQNVSQKDFPNIENLDSEKIFGNKESKVMLPEIDLQNHGAKTETFGMKDSEQFTKYGVDCITSVLNVDRPEFKEKSENLSLGESLRIDRYSESNNEQARSKDTGELFFGEKFVSKGSSPIPSFERLVRSKDDPKKTTNDSVNETKGGHHETISLTGKNETADSTKNDYVDERMIIESKRQKLGIKDASEKLSYSEKFDLKKILGIENNVKNSEKNLELETKNRSAEKNVSGSSASYNSSSNFDLKKIIKENCNKNSEIDENVKKTSVEHEIYTLQKAIEASESAEDTSVQKIPKSPQKNTSIENLSEDHEESFYSTTSNSNFTKILKKTCETTSKDPNMVQEEPKVDLNLSTSSIFSNVNEQKFCSKLFKRPGMVSTPKRHRRDESEKIVPHNSSINEINLFSQEDLITTRKENFEKNKSLFEENTVLQKERHIPEDGQNKKANVKKFVSTLGGFLATDDTPKSSFEESRGKIIQIAADNTTKISGDNLGLKRKKLGRRYGLEEPFGESSGMKKSTETNIDLLKMKSKPNKSFEEFLETKKKLLKNIKDGSGKIFSEVNTETKKDQLETITFDEGSTNVSKTFDDFKSPNISLQKNILRRSILCTTPKSYECSFRSAVSDLTSESPILSNRISKIQSYKRKAESESFMQQMKKMYDSKNVSLPYTSSCVIPTVTQLKNTEKLYVGKRDVHNKMVLKKVDEKQRKLKIRNAKVLLQKCLEQTIQENMVKQNDKTDTDS